MSVLLMNDKQGDTFGGAASSAALSARRPPSSSGRPSIHNYAAGPLRNIDLVMNDVKVLGYVVVVVLRGHQGEIVSREPMPEADAEAELDKLLKPGDEKGLVKAAGMVIDPKDVKAAFLREVRESMLDRLLRDER